MFEQIFKRVDDVLWKDAGCGSELDYVEQTTWILFLKYIDDLEKEKETSAELAGKTYVSIISPEFQWGVWAVPKGKDGKLDHHKALTGDDLNDFVNQKLFPYLKKFKISAENADTIQYKIGEIFSELKNRIQSGYNLREVVNLIDQLSFGSSEEKHEMSHLYESKIQNMGNAGRNGGEYYTPRPLIKTVVKVVNPAIGNKIYDGAVGSAGFLCEAFEYLKNSKELSTKDVEILQKRTLYGKEKKSLAYIIGIMNMIFHGINSPNIIHTNTLAENITDIQEKDRYDIVLANPPFGGKERAEVQQNFPIKTGETAFLFLQHFIKILRAGGKAGVVIKNTFLSNTDNASVSLRRHLLENCNLHTILDMPQGTFLGAGVKTVVLFFDKGVSTKNIWYYQLNLDRNLGKTNPLSERDLAEFVELQKTKADSDNSWTVKVADINQTTFDLSANNPNKKEEAPLREPNEILDEISTLDKESAETQNVVRSLFENNLKIIFEKNKNNWQENKLSDVCKKGSSNVSVNKIKTEEGKYPIYGAKGFVQNVSFYHQDKQYISIIKDGAGIGRIKLREAFSSVIGTLQYLIPEEKVDIKYLYYFLLGIDFLKYAKGAAIPHIYFKDYSNEKIIVPPIEVQKEIVSKLDEFLEQNNKLNNIYQHKLASIEELRKSILQKAFKGELTKGN
jgi:type I restriction enzyme M protein